jgi:2-hydroxychromene-2-carboxylate isomerase
VQNRRPYYLRLLREELAKRKQKNPQFSLRAFASKIGGAKGYFDYMIAMFDYKSTNRTTQLKASGIKDLATTVGLDATALSKCVDSGEMTQKVTDSINDGITAGVSGTPTTFVVVKDRKGLHMTASITGAQTEDYVRKAIEDALKK